MDLNMIANLVRAARATGISSVVRIPDRTPSFITRVLNTIIDGIIVPHVKSKAITKPWSRPRSSDLTAAPRGLPQHGRYRSQRVQLE